MSKSMDYFTVGDEKEPFFKQEADPQHCFRTEKSARTELAFLEKEVPEAGVTSVWHITHVRTQTRLRK